MGCAVEKQKKQLNIVDLETSSRRNMDQIKIDDLSTRLNQEIPQTYKTDTLVVQTDRLSYEIIHQSDKAKLRITNYYIDLDGRKIAKQKDVRNELLKKDFQFSLDSNNIIMKRNLQIVH